MSGVRNAEMKWSKQNKLSVYGVSLVGWPREVEYKNPSRMSSREMTTIITLLRQGTLRFELLRENTVGRSRPPLSETAGSTTDCPTRTGSVLYSDAETDISWAYNDVEHDSNDDDGQG